ncbi:SPOR domain-containing protein [Haliea sp. E17]|uniref:SPOR domain-containing protein n=1 Tax=Haliea sp. E17 TaxID=3401576 RepID=UPI003AAA9EFF
MSDNKFRDDDYDWEESRFDTIEEDEYETSDRDSDFAAIYTEEDEDIDAPPGNIVGELELWDFVEEEDDGEKFDRDTLSDRNSDMELVEEVSIWDTDESDQAYWVETENKGRGGSDAPRERHLSLGLIIVAIVALALLAFGGYGTIEQRATLREEVRQLQAQLATSAPPAEVSASRAAAEEAAGRNRELAEEVEQLSQENRSLQAIVNGLEAQLQTQQNALDRTVASTVTTPPVPTPSTPSKTTATSTSPATTATGSPGTWFVNFSSYNQRETAEKWSGKLQPETGKVIVASGESAGRTVYRVRVVGLSDKATADQVARALEIEFKLPKLWVGQER